MLEILAITTPIYLIILIGAMTVRFGLFRKADMEVLGKLVFNLALPCLLLDALSRRNIHEVINIAYLLAYSTGTLLVIGLGWLWSRYVAGLGATAAVYAAMGMSCPNSAFVGFPILLLTLPAIAPTAFALNLVIENILIIPLLLLLVETSSLAGADSRQIVVQVLRRLISNPLILALIAALTVSLLELKLPAPVSRTITLLAQASSAVSLLVIGGALVGLPLRGMGLKVFPIAVGKLIAHPLAVFAAFQGCALLGLGSVSDELKQAGILFGAMPIMSIYPILGQRHRLEGVSAAALLATTILSFLTLNGLIWWFQSGLNYFPKFRQIL